MRLCVWQQCTEFTFVTGVAAVVDLVAHVQWRDAIATRGRRSACIVYGTGVVKIGVHRDAHMNLPTTLTIGAHEPRVGALTAPLRHARAAVHLLVLYEASM